MKLSETRSLMNVVLTLTYSRMHIYPQTYERCIIIDEKFPHSIRMKSCVYVFVYLLIDWLVDTSIISRLELDFFKSDGTIGSSNS